MNEDKSARYHRLRRRTDLAATGAAGLALLALVLTSGSVWMRETAAAVSGFIPGLEDGVTVVLLTATVFLLVQVIESPFAFYQGYLLEHRYGLSTQSAGHWMADQAKGALLVAAVSVGGASVVYVMLREWPERWWWLSAVAFGVALVGIVRLAPIVLLPVFYRFKPLERPALATRLVGLAKRTNTEVVGVFEWVMSGHTRKANAALTGLGRTRRILLSDTLLAAYSDDEIEVVLAHELAHHVHHDLLRSLALQAAILTGGFFMADLALQMLAGPLGLRGLSDPAGLPLLLLVGGAWSYLAMPLTNAQSRAHERAADRYALQTTQNVDAFVSAMKRLSQQNLAEESPSALVRWLYYSHPPIRERIDAARAFSREGHHAT